ncbi:ATP-binding cassette domain-containing protein [Streptomyces sp. PGLac3x]
MTLLEIDAVHAGYGRSTVLHGVSLTVPRDGVAAVLGHNGAGKSTLLRAAAPGLPGGPLPGPRAGGAAVLGHNGAGKSTLLRAAAGLLVPTRGAVRLDGEDITRLRPHQRVARGLAYVPQGQQCFPHLTAAENLRLVADGRPDGRAATDEALDLFPALRTLGHRPAGLLSGGQRQQLALARALVTRPRLLLLDEPTEGIQPSVVAEIEAAVLALTHRGGLSVLLVEQHVGFALRAAAHYHVLEAGRVTSSGAGGAGAEEVVRGVLRV